MDYKRMWFALKENLMNDKNSGACSKVASAVTALDKMASIEVKEAKRIQEQKEPVACFKSAFDEELGHKPEEKQERKDDLEEAPEVLKDIFGEKFVDSMEELKKRIAERSGEEIEFLLVDGNLDIPEELEEAAKEKKMILARAECMKASGSFPLPGIPIPGFMMGHIIGRTAVRGSRKKDPDK